LKKAKGEIIVCMDADSIVKRDALKKTIGYFNDPKVGAVASSLKVYKPKTFWQKIQSVEYIYNIFLRKVLALMDSVFVVPGPFGLYRKEALERVGGWDEKNITEDMELTFRLQKAGYKIETCLNSIVYTKTPETFKRLIRQRVRWYRGFIITSREYKEMFFNPKFGNLGVYTLPLYVVFVGLLFINISSLVYSIYRIVLDLYSIYFKTGIEIPEIDLRNLDSPILYTTVSNVFWLANIILYAYIFYLSLIMSKEKNFVKNLFSYLVQIFIYPFVLAYSWFLSIIKEILRAKTKWER